MMTFAGVSPIVRVPAGPISLLSAIGRDCVGALQFLPDGAAPDAAGAINARGASDQDIARILGNLASHPLGVGPDQEFRISLAGVQEKTALLYWKNKWHVPHGTTATTHIIKPQIGRLPNGIDLTNSVENEYLCLQLVAALGLPVAKSRIVDFAGRRVLAIERFDRTWTRDGRLLRLPQEDCCQALSVPPARKYESDGGPGVRKISDFLKGSDTPERDQEAFFKAQIVFWLLAATDGHTKNFSIRLSPGGRFVLTPLYDIISAQPSLEARQIMQNEMKLAMAIGNNRHYVVHTVVGRHFVQTAKSCGLPDKTVRGISSNSPTWLVRASTLPWPSCRRISRKRWRSRSRLAPRSASTAWRPRRAAPKAPRSSTSRPAAGVFHLRKLRSDCTGPPNRRSMGHLECFQGDVLSDQCFKLVGFSKLNGDLEKMTAVRPCARPDIPIAWTAGKILHIGVDEPGLPGSSIKLRRIAFTTATVRLVVSSFRIAFLM
jgi:serine/threonine protein kinase HipA of HipAB toxin-antitoxin module